MDLEDPEVKDSPLQTKNEDVPAPESVTKEEGALQIPFFLKVLPWVAIVILAVIAAVLTRVASPLMFYLSELELIDITRFARLIFSFVWFALFFALIRKLPFWAGGIIFTIFFLPSVFSAYLRIVYGMELNYAFVVDCANTDAGEVASHFSVVAVAILIGFVLLMFAASWLVKKIPAKLPRSKIFITALVVVLALSANQTNLRAWISPVKIVLDLKDCWIRYQSGDKLMFEKLAELEEEPQEVSRVPKEISHVNVTPIVVLHLGETARADHAPFNGYARNTMPNMLREYEAGNLISFPKCVSFATQTLLSAHGILSPSTVLDNVFRHTTFIPALNQSGVETCGFISRYSGEGDAHSKGMNLVLRALQEKNYTPGLADTFLPKIREVLERDAKKVPPKERFYFYYGEGSHGPYNGYDFNKYAVFKPNLVGIHRYDVNNYDNTFIATDDFIEGFINALRDENAVYIFVGDHGTMLGEEGMHGRPFQKKQSRHVLFFVWCSEKFKTENPELWATLLNNKDRLGIISHDFVYNSVLHLFSLKTPFYDEKADLFSESAEPFPKEIPDAKTFGPLRFGEEAEEVHSGTLRG